MRISLRTVLPALCVALALSLNPAQAARAQEQPSGPEIEARAKAPASAPVSRFRQYPWNGFAVWAGDSYETRSASHNEHIAGSLRMVGVQISRDVWRGERSRLTYVGEILPIMLARSGPPLGRAPDTIPPVYGYFDPARVARFRFRNAYGFGLAPFGAEVARRISTQASVLMNITAGALLFSRVVPYGEATKANFTVSPGVAVQWEPPGRTQMALGYTFHHLSNASFGHSNPGMNSQIIYLRLSRLKRAAPGN